MNSSSTTDDQGRVHLYQNTTAACELVGGEEAGEGEGEDDKRKRAGGEEEEEKEASPSSAAASSTSTSTSTEAVTEPEGIRLAASAGGGGGEDRQIGKVSLGEGGSEQGRFDSRKQQQQKQKQQQSKLGQEGEAAEGQEESRAGEEEAAVSSVDGGSEQQHCYNGKSSSSSSSEAAAAASATSSSCPSNSSNISTTTSTATAINSISNTITITAASTARGLDIHQEDPSPSATASTGASAAAVNESRSNGRKPVNSHESATFTTFTSTSTSSSPTSTPAAAAVAISHLNALSNGISSSSPAPSPLPASPSGSPPKGKDEDQKQKEGQGVENLDQPPAPVHIAATLPTTTTKTTTTTATCTSTITTSTSTSTSTAAAANFPSSASSSSSSSSSSSASSASSSKPSKTFTKFHIALGGLSRPGSSTFLPGLLSPGALTSATSSGSSSLSSPILPPLPSPTAALFGFKTATPSPPVVTPSLGHPSFALTLRNPTSATAATSSTIGPAATAEPDEYFFGFSRIPPRSNNGRRNSEVGRYGKSGTVNGSAATQSLSSAVLSANSGTATSKGVSAAVGLRRNNSTTDLERIGHQQLKSTTLPATLCCVNTQALPSFYLFPGLSLPYKMSTGQGVATADRPTSSRSSLRLKLPPPPNTVHAHGCRGTSYFAASADTPEDDEDARRAGFKRTERNGLVGGLPLLTPPEEGMLHWKDDGSRAHRDARNSHSVNGRKEEGRTESDGGEGTGGGERPAERASENTNGTVLDASALGNGEWLADALEAVLSTGLPVHYNTEAVRILSYTLPCPITMGEREHDKPLVRQQDRLPYSASSAPAVAAAAGYQLSPSIAARCQTGSPGTAPSSVDTGQGVLTVENLLIQSIQHLFNRHNRQAYIHVSHAISPAFPLNRVPSTPPCTGGMAGTPGDGRTPDVGPSGQRPDDSSAGGYFSPSVFNSIVLARSMPATAPNPILPPSSLHYSLFERYIPPPTIAEDSLLFHPTRSPLLDRLSELSPCTGTLLFIYPTLAGAQTFLDSYLSPVLDPLLRNFMVLYGLKESLLWEIRKMESVPQMRSYAALVTAMQQFAQNANAKVVFSCRRSIRVREVAWREWWAEQECSRIRRAVKSSTAESGGQPAGGAHRPTFAATGKNEVGAPARTTSHLDFIQGYGLPGDLAREILDAVRLARPSSKGMEAVVNASRERGTGMAVGAGEAAGGKKKGVVGERDGVECGVFVLRRGG